VTFATGTTIFTDPTENGLSRTHYGAMFCRRSSPRSPARRSALLPPLTTSFARDDVSISTATAEMVTASHQLGLAIGAFGSGPLQDVVVILRAIFTGRRLSKDRPDADQLGRS
jgi:hypothetical protein